MKNGLSNRNYFRQAPKLVGGKYSLSTGESDLVYALLTEIEKDDEDFKDYVFSIKDLEKKIGKQVNKNQLYKNARGLMEKVIEIKKDDNKWKLITWFSYFGYDNGIITCTIDKRLKEHLLELKQYVLADIRQISKMGSTYSKRIYMMCKQSKDFGKFKIEVEELMEILQVPKSLKVYNNFKQRVLEQAIKEINLHSDIEVSYEEKKLGRKISVLIFKIKKNENDIKSFIDTIRELYVNIDLYEDKNGKILKCSEKGLLYYKESPMEWIDEKTAKKKWEYLFKIKEKLYCFTADLFEIEKNMEKLKHDSNQTS